MIWVLKCKIQDSFASKTFKINVKLLKQFESEIVKVNLG